MNRIDVIVKMVEGHDVLLDIGSDHGLVVISALEKGYVKKAIATDNKLGPLKQTAKRIKQANLTEKVELIKTDGFLGINLDYDVVVITGMGAKTIQNILKMPHKKAQTYILGPQSELEEFRRFLSFNYYEIIDEEIVYEKKPYIIIKARYNIEAKRLSKKDIILGPILKTKQQAKPYYEQKIKSLEKRKKYGKEKQINNIIKQIDLYKTVIDKYV